MNNIRRKNINHYTIDGKNIDVMAQDWDFLLVLDACRYDCFKEVYQDVIPVGHLQKAISPATWTMEWLEKIFNIYYKDIIYISGNPFVNSFKAVNYKDKYGEVRHFEATNHFYKIVDAWKIGERLGIPPQSITKSFMNTYFKYPKKRYILHFMQPHRPYLTEGGMPNRIPETKKDGNNIAKKLFTKFTKQIPERQAWEIKKLLNLPMGCTAEQIYRKEGKEGVFRVYKNEIKLVLSSINNLLEAISGKWLITADHGERLCDWWWYNHNGRKRDKAVVEVPWLELKT